MRALAFALVLALACGSKPDDGAVAAPPAKRVSIPVRVDRRIELVSLVARLAQLPAATDAPASVYVTELDKAFRKYDTHPAIAAVRDVSVAALVALAVQLDDKYRIAADRTGLAARLREFAADTGWDAFFDRHGSSFARVADTLRTVLDAEDPIAWFDALGPREDVGYTVVPGLAAGPHTYLVRATSPDGTPQLYRVIGVRRPDGMVGTDDETLALAIRGLAHAYVEPVIDRRATVLDAADKVFSLVEKRVAAFGMSSRDAMVKESAAGALAILYQREKRNPDAATAAARAELRRGLVWTNELVELFRRARIARAGFPDLVAFFDGLARAYAHGLPRTPFLGAVETVLAVDHVVISPSGDEETAAYVRTVFERAATATDDSLVHHPNTGLVAFGAPGDNLVVAHALEWSRIAVAPDAIALGARRYTGTDLVLVFAWFRRDDPTRGIAVYTAQRGADLLGVVAGVPLAGRDWYVARRTRDGFMLVDSGDFPRATDGAWTMPPAR